MGEIVRTLRQIIDSHAAWLAGEPDGTQLVYSSLSQAERAQFRGADLSEENLRSANLFDADLMDTNLMGADLSEAVLCRAFMYGANLSRATLENANLENAIVSSADFRAAQLSGAQLSGAMLTNADFTEAVLTDALFVRPGEPGGPTLFVEIILPHYYTDATWKHATLPSPVSEAAMKKRFECDDAIAKRLAEAQNSVVSLLQQHFVGEDAEHNQLPNTGGRLGSQNARA